MRTLSLKLPDALYRDLADLAEAEGVNRSELVRRALRLLFQRTNRPKRHSALAGLEDLVGAIDGPEDLSSNPAHLEDMGRRR